MAQSALTRFAVAPLAALTRRLADVAAGRAAAETVITGARLAEGDNRSPSPLESSISGVYAVGDVRSGSTKRVGSAIGEGAQVVQAIHGFLAQSPGPHL